MHPAFQRLARSAVADNKRSKSGTMLKGRHRLPFSLLLIYATPQIVIRDNYQAHIQGKYGQIMNSTDLVRYLYYLACSRNTLSAKLF